VRLQFLVPTGKAVEMLSYLTGMDVRNDLNTGELEFVHFSQKAAIFTKTNAITFGLIRNLPFSF
jgi:hypothetical protein